jgi:hypothetical protein
MYEPDAHLRRQLVRERQAELNRDWHRTERARPELAESRRQHWHLRWNRVLSHLRPASHTS